MRFYKKILCFLLAAVLLLAAPGAVLALEGEDAPGAESLVQAADEPVDEEEPAEEPMQPAAQDAPAAKMQAQPLVSIGGGGFTLAPAEDLRMYPIVRVSGAMNDLIVHEGTDDYEVVGSKDIINVVLEEVLAVAGKMMLSLSMFNYEKATEPIVKYLWDNLGPIRMNEDGDSYNPDVTISTGWYALWQDENGHRIFNDDWRVDPWDSAALLKKVIDDSGFEKVNLMGASGNGNTVLAYLKRYGTHKLASVFFNFSLHEGSSIYGGLATRQLGPDPLALGNMSILKMNEIYIEPDPVEWIFRALYETGFIHLVQKLYSFNYDKMKQKLYDEAMTPLFFMMPHIWSYVPLDQYEEAKQLLLKGDPKYDKLVERIDRYHYEVMAKAGEILRDAAKEIKVAVRASYNNALYGYALGTGVHGDEKVDTRYASFGATCAPLNYTFPSSYRQKVPSEYDYISPDRVVDASTCAIPEVTWFGNDQPHRGSGEYEGWYEWFLGAEEDYTVHGNPEYPQYLKHLGHDVYIPLVAAPRPAIFEYLNVAALWMMKAWRFLLLLPMF